MMEVSLPRSWKEEFERAAALDREEILYRERMKRFEARERERREEVRVHQEQHDRDEGFRAFAAALAPPATVIEYRHDLTRYNEKTVEALLENQEAMDSVRKRINKMMTEAHVLPDGRRVWKSEDGQRVFDEHGQELPREVVDPSSIDDRKTRWEVYKADKDALVRLEKERGQLIDFQTKTDAAMDRLDKGEITNAELDSIKDDLAAGMPDTVRDKLGMDKPKADAAQNTPAAAPKTPDIDAMLRQSGLGGPSGP